MNDDEQRDDEKFQRRERNLKLLLQLPLPPLVTCFSWCVYLVCFFLMPFPVLPLVVTFMSIGWSIVIVTLYIPPQERTTRVVLIMASIFCILWALPMTMWILFDVLGLREPMP